MNHGWLGSRGMARKGVLAPVAILAVLAVAVVVGVTLYNGSNARATDAASLTGPGSDWFVVQPTSFDLTIVADGELQAKEQVEIKSAVNGKPAIIELVDEGTVVRQGDVLVRLDQEQLIRDIEEQQLKVEQSRIEKVSAEQNLQIDLSDAESTAKEAEVARQLARLELREFEEGTVPMHERELRLELEKAQRGLTRVRKDLELSEQLYAEKFISEADLEDARIEVLEAESALASAQIGLEVYDKYTLSKERQTNESALEQAEAEYIRTLKKNENTISRRQAELAGEVRSLKIQEERLAELERQLAATVMSAPQDGLVVYASSVGGRRWRGEPIAPGREVRLNETILLLPDTRQMIASLKVHEALVPQVNLGDEVLVTVDAKPEASYVGQVTNIGVMAADGGWLNPQLREYAVTCELPAGVDPSLKPAMRCTGHIKTGRVEDALAVPVQAIFAEGDQRYVLLPTAPGSDKVQRQAVKTGRASETMIEIMEGLEPGRTVLMRSPRPGEEIGL